MKVKLIFLFGNLGSGKTTLIRNLLSEKDLSFKYAIIQNEFSEEMGIELPIMNDINSDIFDNFYELPNGCLCCSAKFVL